MSVRDKEINKSLAAALFCDWLKGVPAKTLDVGSKYPYLAHCLQALGCEAYGMDLIEAVPAYSRDLGVSMLMADFEALSEDQIRAWTSTEKFGLVTMVHVFEHMYDPLEALRRLRRLVSEDGVIFIRLPDHGVGGFQRDLTPSHYTIHPFFHSLSSLLELLVRGQDLFTVRQTYPLNGAGQRDLILRPIVKKPVVFAGLIVKNEERDLPRCLRSIETVVDGVVIVDTGSTDTTLEVACRATSMPIYAQTYTDASRLDEAGDWKIWDFSKARNVFVREIEERGADYLLWVDADDELLTPGSLRRAFYWDQYDVFGMQVESAGSRWTHHRAWKTGLGIHFQGRCHEYPTYGGHASIVLIDTVVQHHAEPGGGENSNARNLRILLEEFTEAPTPRTAFYLANTYRDARRYAEAVPWYERRIAFGGNFRDDEWLFACLYKARCQRWTKDLAGARATLQHAHVVAPGWSEFWMEQAYCSYAQRDYHKTIHFALVARDKPQPPTQLWREPNKYTDQPPRIISWCYEHRGEIDNALTWALRARDKIVGRDDEWEERIDRLRQGDVDDARDAAVKDNVGDADVKDDVDGAVDAVDAVDAADVNSKGTVDVVVSEGTVVDVVDVVDVNSEGNAVDASSEGNAVDASSEGNAVDASSEGNAVDASSEGNAVVANNEGAAVDSNNKDNSINACDAVDKNVSVLETAIVPRAVIAICRPGAIGDVLMTLNLVPLLRQKWPLHDVHYYCHPDIGSGLRDIILASGVTEVGDASRLNAGRYTKVFNLIGYPLHEGYPVKPMRRHLLDYFADELELSPSVMPALRLPRPSSAMPALRLPRPSRLSGTRGSYATLQVKTGWSAYKNWPVERWAEVVRACPEIPVYQIGRADEPLVDGALQDFMGASLSSTIALVANATLHLGLDSFANHLTHYLWEDGNSVQRVPAVILWGSTQVSALGYDHNTNISLGLACQPCFREDPAISRMPRGPCIKPPGQFYTDPRHACMLGIDVGRVVCAVKELWKREAP